MSKSRSVSEARSALPSLVRGVERGGPVKITRRGKPVAVLLSSAEYDRLTAARPTFAEAYEAWRSAVAPGDEALEPSYFPSLRDRSPGRAVKL